MLWVMLQALHNNNNDIIICIMLSNCTSDVLVLNEILKVFEITMSNSFISVAYIGTAKNDNVYSI